MDVCVHVCVCVCACIVGVLYVCGYVERACIYMNNHVHRALLRHRKEKERQKEKNSIK